MKSILFSFSFALAFLSFQACTNEGKQNQEDQEKAQKKDIPLPTTEGFSSPQALASAVLVSLQNEDFDGYAKYVLPIEIIEALALQIENEAARKDFREEMEFSHEMEKDYFKNLVKKLKNDHINLDSIPLADVITYEYEKGKYRPLELTAILIDIEVEALGMDEVLVIVAIRYQDKWYATAELEA